MLTGCHRGQKGGSLDRRVEETLRQKRKGTQRRRGREELQGRRFGGGASGAELRGSFTGRSFGGGASSGGPAAR